MAVSYEKYFRMAKEKGITTSRILEEANISANILTRMKRNEYISLESVEKICRALQCDISDILDFTDEGKQEDGSMTDAEQREAARQFVNRWLGKGKEDEDGRSYWIDLLTSVLGMDNVTERLNFEKKVVIDGNTKRIDVYIPETRVIIEQKSLGKALDQKIRNSGEIDLTPFEQADRYNSKLTFDERARWIVTSNFAEIWIYDMNQKQPEPTKIALDELQSKYPLLDFLVKKELPV